MFAIVASFWPSHVDLITKAKEEGRLGVIIIQMNMETNRTMIFNVTPIK